MIPGFTIKDIKEGLTKGHFTAEEVFKKYLEKVKKENKKLNAYLSTFDFKPSTFNSQFPLAGVPAAIKDNMLISGTVCTAGSKMLENYIAAYDATVIKKLRSAGV